MFRLVHLLEFGTTPCTAKFAFVTRSCFTLTLLLAFSQVRADAYEPLLEAFETSAAEQRFVYTSLYTTHYDPDPDHVDGQPMVGVEFEIPGNRLVGMAFFDNSFGQDSQYLYWGKKWHVRESEHWYLKLTGGLLRGYKEPYDDKIPFNGLGIAPAVIPAIGYRYKNRYVEFVQLGFAAGMITVGRTF